MGMKSMRSASDAGKASGESTVGKRSGAGRREPAKGDVGRLDVALGKTNEPGSRTPDAKQAGGGSDELVSLFGMAMRGLPGQPANPKQGQPAPVREAAAPARPAAAETAARCEELVDRIMASPPSADGSAEVRIKVDKPWLPDTEVRLTLSPDARLEVEFRADSVEAQRFLLPNLDNLRERLAERRDNGVAVRMTESSREGDSGDGRSRNRRDVIEEYNGE